MKQIHYSWMHTQKTNKQTNKKLSKTTKVEIVIHKQKTSKTKNIQAKQYETKVSKNIIESIWYWLCTARHGSTLDSG